MGKQRVKYLDITKGLLILGVIFAHVLYFFWGELFDDRMRLSFLGTIVIYSYSPYIMAAFFILHGYYSRQEKSIEEICKYGIKRILVPMTILLLGNQFWFCWAMFFTIIIYSIIRRIKPGYLQVPVIFLLSLIGLLLNDMGANVVYICHAMVMVPFLYIGEHCKIMVENSVVGVVGGLLYLLLSIIMFLHKEFPPFIGAELFFFSYLKLPLFYILAISGTSAIISVSRLIGSSLFLEYIGQNSLLYCLFHISFSLLVLKIVNVTPLIEHASPIAYVFYSFGLFIFLVLVTSVFCALINKYVPWIMGKGL